jgi:hypothetical protein
MAPDKIGYGRPQYSYEVNHNIPYQTENERSHQNVNMVQRKKYALSKVHGYHNRPLIPMMQRAEPRVQLKSSASERLEQQPRLSSKNKTGKMSQTPLYQF